VDHSYPPVFLDKESFGELPGDSRREMDLVARLRLHDGDAHFLVHVEHEAQNRGDFPERMFGYFARLWERYKLPIYPIAVFSAAARQARPQSFQLIFQDRVMLDFRYHIVECVA